MVDSQRLVLLLTIVCNGVLLWRLWTQKLVRVYLYLAAFLIGDTVQSAIALPFDPNSRFYLWILVSSSPLIWILAYLVVLELYRLVLEDYPGIASVGRKAVSWFMVLAVGVALAYAIPDLIKPKTQLTVLHTYVVFERSIVLGLLVFLVLIQLFLLRYRLRLSPNRMVYATGYALFFALFAGWDVIITGLGRILVDYTLWVVVISDLILLAGAALLSQQGEVKPQLDTVDTSPERAHLQQQLADINRMLSRAARGRG